MNARESSPSLRSEINVTPLIDVVLVLLIVFMVVVPMLQRDQPVQLPQAADPDRASDAERPVVLVVTAPASPDRGALWLGKERFERAELRARLDELQKRDPRARVRVKADARLAYGAVKSVMLAVRDAGFGDVAIVTERVKG